MKKRMLILVLVALVASLGFATVAAAKTIEGTGTLTAKGAGIAVVHGDGSVEIQGHGVGVVWVKNAESLEAHGHGIRKELPGGAVLFAGWSGQISASGSNLTVRMKGGRIEFTATGTGWVYLKGRGTYEIGDRSGRWSANGTLIRLAPNNR
ncbi:MAG: hypothetical protein ACE5NP_00640 [Anaerolineae bacterium]